jgi:hypothetical protein
MAEIRCSAQSGGSMNGKSAAASSTQPPNNPLVCDDCGHEGCDCADGPSTRAEAMTNKSKAASSTQPRWSDFDEWWQCDGKYFDPDTDDVPWFDKRKELAEYAWHRAKEAK